MDILFIKSSSFSSQDRTQVGTALGGTVAAGFTQSGNEVIRVSATPARLKTLAGTIGNLANRSIYVTITLGVDRAAELAAAIAGMGSTVGLQLASTAQVTVQNRPGYVVQNLIIDGRNHDGGSIRLYNCPGATIRNCLVFGNANADDQHAVVLSRCDRAVVDRLGVVGGSAQAFSAIRSSGVRLLNSFASAVDCHSETFGFYPGAPWTFPDLAALWYSPSSESWAFADSNRWKSHTNLGGWVGDPDLLRLVDHPGGRAVTVNLGGIDSKHFKNPRKSLVDRVWMLRTADQTIARATCTSWDEQNGVALIDAGVSLPAGLVAWYCFDEAYRPQDIVVKNLEVIGKSGGSDATGLSLYHCDGIVVDNVRGSNLNDYVAGVEFCRRAYCSQIRAVASVTNERHFEATFHCEDVHVRSASGAGFYPHGCPARNCTFDREAATNSIVWSGTGRPDAGDINRMINWFDDVKVNSAPMSVPSFVTATDPFGSAADE